MGLIRALVTSLIPPLAKQDLGSLPPFQNYAINPTGQGFYTGTQRVLLANLVTSPDTNMAH